VSDNLSWQDPQVYLKSLVDTKDLSNYHDIVDFISMSGNLSAEEKLLSNSSSGQLVFKSGPVKPKLETVTNYGNGLWLAMLFLQDAG
jgi:hypothetical protein